MAQLRQDYSEFVKRGAEVVVIGPEDAKAFERYWREHDLPFIGLPDPKASVLKQYGQEVNLFKLGRMPAQVIVDKNGIARFVHYGHSMSDIPENAEVLSLLDQLNSGSDSGTHGIRLPLRAEQSSSSGFGGASLLAMLKKEGSHEDN
jgi:peroxiredoxin